MYDVVNVLNKTKIVLYITNEFISELEKKFDQRKQKKSKAKSNADVLYKKSEAIREIFQILGNLLKSYNHSSTFVIKFVHIIKNTDINYQNTLIRGVFQIKDNFDINSIVSILTKEILVLAEKESSGDSVNLKQMMNFINDLAVVRPKEMVVKENSLKKCPPKTKICTMLIQISFLK